MQDIISPGFGLARIKREGTPVHPDDLTWECNLEVCSLCKERYNRQLKAYNNYWKGNNGRVTS